jgi:hypothetical protein
VAQDFRYLHFCGLPFLVIPQSSWVDLVGLRYFAGSRRGWHSRLVAWNHGGSEAGASTTHCNDATGNRKQSPLLLRLGEFATPTTSAGDIEIKRNSCLPHVRNSSEIDMPGGSLAGQEESRHRCEFSAKVYEGGVDCHPLACGQVIPEAHRMMVSWKRMVSSNSMMVMNINLGWGWGILPAAGMSQ